jgi:hypothetical protein
MTADDFRIAHNLLKVQDTFIFFIYNVFIVQST